MTLPRVPKILKPKKWFRKLDTKSAMEMVLYHSYLDDLKKNLRKQLRFSAEIEFFFFFILELSMEQKCHASQILG